MKTKIKVEQEIEVSAVEISIPVEYGDEDIPYDFPLRRGDKWKAVVEIDTGKIIGWPQGKEGRLQMKVHDGGTYTLLGPQAKVIEKREQEYVPNELIPGEYGDYIDLQINTDGIITNWPKRPDLSDFFPDDHH